MFDYDVEQKMEFEPSGEFLCPVCYTECLETIGMEC
jgi:hypothetical protein